MPPPPRPYAPIIPPNSSNSKLTHYPIVFAFACSPPTHPKNKSQKRGKFSPPKTLLLRTSEDTPSTTNSPQNYHPKTPVFPPHSLKNLSKTTKPPPISFSAIKAVAE
jgi:hypothetical protein